MKSHLIGPVVCGLLAFVSLSPVASARDAAKPVPVSETELHESIAILASDDFGGRAPGTPGETKTIAYIAQAFADAGLQGGAKDASSWYEPVDMVRSTPQRGSFVARANGQRLAIASNQLIMLSDLPASRLDGLPVVYAGHGVNGQGKTIDDVSGALVIIQTDEPDYLPEGGDLRAFEARSRALRDAGAKAIIAVLGDETDFAQLSRGLLGREKTRLAVRDPALAAMTGLASKSWLSALATTAGIDIDALSTAEQGPDYRGTALNFVADVSTANQISDLRSYNVVAKLAGSDPAAGAVMFTGHWDHLGTCRPEGAPDRICNGAVDNASGIAVLIAVAKRLAQLGPFARDIYFVATTAEEKGLLGAYAMAENPPVPLDRIIVALNIDTIAIARRHSKVAIIGRGKTDLDSIVDHVARKLGRSVDSSDEANSFIRRQDGWALSQRGVPALMVGGSFSDMKLLEAFLSGDYHGPGDELTDATPLDGAAEDADLHVALGAYFANADAYQPKAKD